MPVRYNQAASVRKTAAMVNRDALVWLDTRPRDRPFFVFLNYFDAHTPFLSPEAPILASARPGCLMPNATASSVANSDCSRIRPPRLVSTFRTQSVPPPKSAAIPTRAASRLSIARSVCCSTNSKRRGFQGYLFVLTSDHGEHLDERGFHGHGISLYKPETHIPLLVLPPTSESGVAKLSVDTPVSLRDVAATVVDLLDCPDWGRLPRQCLAASSPGNNSAHFPLLAELGRRDGLQPNPRIPTSLGTLKALVDRDLLYLRNGDGREELYNLAADPQETRNLAADPAHARRSRV